MPKPALLTALFLAACPTSDADDTGGVACTEYAAASVTVYTTDLDGNALGATAVTFTVDGGDVQQASCLTDECTQWVTAYEVAGTFEITASLNADTEDPCCWIDDEASETVTIETEPSGCHVEGQVVTLALDPAALVCADDETDCG